MLEIASRRLQARLSAFVHILCCIKKHLCWDGCCNLLYRLLLVQFDNLSPERTPRQKSCDGSDLVCRAASFDLKVIAYPILVKVCSAILPF